MDGAKVVDCLLHVQEYPERTQNQMFLDSDNRCQDLPVRETKNVNVEGLFLLWQQ